MNKMEHNSPPIKNLDWSIRSSENINFKISYTHSILSNHEIIDELSETNRIFLIIDSRSKISGN